MSHRAGLSRRALSSVTASASSTLSAVALEGLTVEACIRTVEHKQKLLVLQQKRENELRKLQQKISASQLELKKHVEGCCSHP